MLQPKKLPRLELSHACAGSHVGLSQGTYESDAVGCFPQDAEYVHTRSR